MLFWESDILLALIDVLAMLWLDIVIHACGTDFEELSGIFSWCHRSQPRLFGSNLDPLL